ncbi:MAG: FHA domain-containing protein, partial [Candidatus Aminicenantes bacterium]|nr:FHA domain-containing protein [Candidatus Aminicenantes bacterium]
MNNISELRVQIRGINGDYNGIDYTIEGDEFLIGRHFDCDLVLKEKTVSSKHAKIIKKENYFEIEDLDSSNGTFVNKKKITKQKLRTEDI